MKEKIYIIFYNNPQFLLFSFVFLKTFLSFQTLFPANAKCRQSVSRRKLVKEKCWKQKRWFGSAFFCVLYIWQLTKEKRDPKKSIYELAMFDWIVFFFYIFELLRCCCRWVRANEGLPYFFAVSLPFGFCHFTLLLPHRLFCGAIFFFFFWVK